MARLCTDWLKSYIEYTEHSEAPEKFHFWSGVSVLAGALRRKCWVDMGYFKWYPNFFVFFVAPPGIVSKSTTADIGMELLEEVPGINFGPAHATWQSLVDKMVACQEQYPMGTVNGMMEYLPMSSLTVVARELGTFLNPQNREQVDVLVSLWDGKEGAWSRSTLMRGEESIENPWLNLVGCTTPAWVAENFTDYFSGGGLSSRVVFVYADTKRKLVAYPKRQMRKKHEDLRENLIKDLKVIAKIKGAYTLTEEAYTWGEQWYEEHYFGENKHLRGEKFSGYLARKQTHMHKVAMVISASYKDETVIEVEDLQRAEAELNRLEEDMPKVFGNMNREAEMILAADVLISVQKVRKVGKTELYRQFFRTMSYDTYERIIKSLVGTGLVGVAQNGNKVYLVDKEKEVTDGEAAASLAAAADQSQA